jgi:hypothetical protein
MALIAVIGKHWLTVTQEDGIRRLDNPEDLVRIEIATALERNIRVIPVLVGGACMPRSQDLPESLAPLARRNAIEIPDSVFHQALERLVEVLKNNAGTPSHSSVRRPAPQNEWLKVVLSAVGLRSRLDSSSPLAQVSLWRRWLLLYWPYSFAGCWIFRPVFFLGALYTTIAFGAGVMGHLTTVEDWLILAGATLVSWLAWHAAFWCDERALRRRSLPRSSPQLERKGN